MDEISRHDWAGKAGTLVATFVLLLFLTVVAVMGGYSNSPEGAFQDPFTVEELRCVLRQLLPCR
jgi:hypothetical protein